MCPQCQASGITDTNEQLRVNEKSVFCYVADAWTSSCTIKHDTETVRLYFIEAKDALVADDRCLLFLINFLFNFIRLFK